MDDVLYKAEVNKIIGRCMAVYNELGDGFLKLGLLVNFCDPNELQWSRLINTKKFVRILGIREDLRFEADLI